MKKIVSDIFPRRLRQARLMRGLSLEKLAQSMASPVSRQAINKYEQGQIMPNSRILIDLANALNLKVDYFFRPFTIEIDKVEFRRKSGFTDKKANSLKSRVREELERYLEIEQLAGASQRFALPKKEVSSTQQAQEFARVVRHTLSLGQDGISNVIEVLEDNGIKVIELNEDEGFDGLSGLVNSEIALIVVNGNFATERKRFTALHELGHLLMEFPACMASKEIEHLCNIFASELLLPAEVLKFKMGTSRHDISLAELTDIQQQFGISIDDIMAHLCQLNVISDNRYAVFQKKKNTMADFKALIEQSRIEIEKSGRFARMVYRALADEIITFSKAAVLLNTSVENVKSNLLLV